MHKTRCFVALLLGLLTLPVAALAQDQRAATQQLARDIFEQLIEINTTDSQGNTTEAAEAMAARLQAAGFPAEDVQVLGPHPRKGNLVARLQGNGSRAPLLLLAHLDVVEARREDWSVDPFTFALMRTTCVATMLDAGHAQNALPQTASAVVNCRILPGESHEGVQQTLVRVLADDQIAVTPMGTPTPSPPSPLDPEIMEPIERITEAMWPGVPVVPTMLTGATDGLALRNAGIPTYGVSGLFGDVDDIRAHGQDERIGVEAFYEGQTFLYRLVKALSSAQ